MLHICTKFCKDIFDGFGFKVTVQTISILCTSTDDALYFYFSFMKISWMILKLYSVSRVCGGRGGRGERHHYVN